jgi:homoaconitase/3-isopropylmalate dehydratase large subunit
MKIIKLQVGQCTNKIEFNNKTKVVHQDLMLVISHQIALKGQEGTVIHFLVQYLNLPIKLIVLMSNLSIRDIN